MAQLSRLLERLPLRQAPLTLARPQRRQPLGVVCLVPPSHLERQPLSNRQQECLASQPQHRRWVVLGQQGSGRPLRLLALQEQLSHNSRRQVECLVSQPPLSPSLSGCLGPNSSKSQQPLGLAVLPQLLLRLPSAGLGRPPTQGRRLLGLPQPSLHLGSELQLRNLRPLDRQQVNFPHLFS